MPGGSSSASRLEASEPKHSGGPIGVDGLGGVYAEQRHDLLCAPEVDDQGVAVDDSDDRAEAVGGKGVGAACRYADHQGRQHPDRQHRQGAGPYLVRRCHGVVRRPLWPAARRRSPRPQFVHTRARNGRRAPIWLLPPPHVLWHACARPALRRQATLPTVRVSGRVARSWFRLCGQGVTLHRLPTTSAHPHGPSWWRVRGEMACSHPCSHA